MDVKIEKMKAMTFTGFVKEIEMEKGYDQIPGLWHEVMQENLFESLSPFMDELGPVGISYDYNMDTGNFKYMIGIRNDIDKVENTEKFKLEEQDYAVFKSVGPMPTAMQETITKAHNEWLPSSDYKHAGNAEIEIYTGGDPSGADYISYVWISVENK